MVDLEDIRDSLPTIDRKDFVLAVLVFSLFAATVFMSVMYFTKDPMPPSPAKGHICWNNKWVENLDDCPEQMCTVPEEYTELEDYTEYEATPGEECFNSTQIDTNCTIRHVKYAKVSNECILNPGKVSCTINNLEEDISAEFTVSIGFREMFGETGETQTKTIYPGELGTFTMATDHAVDDCYCREEMPKKEICIDDIVTTQICHNTTKYVPVTKQKKVTRYRLVEKPCD